MTQALAEPQLDSELDALRSDPELASMFIAEALDHLGTIEAAVLQLEVTPDDLKLLNDIFRPFHTVKGNAGALGVSSIQQLAHKVENLLDLARSGRLRIGGEETDVILRSVDILTTMVSDLNVRLAGQPPRDVTAARAALIETLDSLTTADRSAARPDARSCAPGTPADAAPPTPAVPTPSASASTPEAVAPTPAAPAPTRGASEPVQTSVKVDTGKLDSLVDMVGELVIVQSIIQADPAHAGRGNERLGASLAQLHRITTELQRNAMSLRMVPIRQTFQKMARLVRDLSKKSGKPVELVLSGEDTELDRKVVEDINDPLMHMVRNSMDHGLETAERRLAAGKSEAGRLSLGAYHEGGKIVIRIEDDGAGLDVDRILAKARAQGIVAEDETLTPGEIHQLIFRPGFSTAEKVTDISGRGVGMDVVRRNIDALRGRIDIQTTPGQGTTFLIKLPLTLAILDGLVLLVGRERYVLPTFSVRESLRPLPEHLHTVQGEACAIRVRDSVLPLVDLARLLGVPGGGRPADQGIVVVVEDDGRAVALVVDELVGKQEVVIKSLGAAFAGLRGIAGGAILGDGRIGLILDAAGIITLARGGAGRAA